MIKAKDFWQFMCVNLDYRFFSGVPSIGLKPLYDTMSAEFMHYVPAIDDGIALGLVSGAFLSGYKGAVLIAPDKLVNVMTQYNKFNKPFNIPTLFITYNLQDDMGLPVWLVEQDLSILNDVDYHLYTLKKGGSIVNIKVV